MSDLTEYELGQITEAIERGIRDGLSEQPTLRDRFAMAALQGISVGLDSHYVSEPQAEALADSAYRVADAMLAAREPKVDHQ